jgi:hypothetical protein
MGLVYSSLKFLLEARKLGVRFDETITLGRQHMTVSPERAAGLLQEYGFWPPEGGEEGFLNELRKAQWRFEIFARSLGAKKVASMDISDYEGATIVHSLNDPAPKELYDRYDLLIDGGTLEHVFNVPVSMESCMRMVKVGGHIVVITNINNMVGHGFYQFSPEFFFRVFAPENGFEVKSMVALEDGFARSSILGVKYDFPFSSPWYNVHDPDKVRKRNLLMTKMPTVLFMLAKKVENKPLFKEVPRQSEYGADDQSVLNPSNQSSLGRMVIGNLVKRFPEKIWRDLVPRLGVVLDPFRRWRYRKMCSFGDKDFFSRKD